MNYKLIEPIQFVVKLYKNIETEIERFINDIFY